MIKDDAPPQEAGAMGGLHLIARIGGERVAIATASVESVIEVEALTPVPRVGAHVAGLAPLRSRVLTIIDARASLELAGTAPADRPAIVVGVDGHCYGLLVDEVEDVVALAGAPRAIGRGLAPGWARVTLGVIEHGGAALLLIDPAALIAGPPALAA